MTEGQHAEWKSSWRDEYLKWLCSFANAQGGVLEIGRNDAGQVVGVKDAKRLLEELPNKLRDVLGIVAEIDLLKEDGKPYLRIAVEPDPVPISYPGELPEGWSMETLLGQHPSQPFNPDLANTFFWAGDIEAWGRGIQRILGACRAAGTPEPRIRVEGRNVWVEFPFSEAYLDSLASGEEPIGVPGQTTQETTQERILALLREEPTVTRKAMAERIGITADGIKYHLGQLRAAGRIRHIGPTKKGRWEILGVADE